LWTERLDRPAMADLIAAFEAAREPAAEANDILKVLFHTQVIFKESYFAPLPDDDVRILLREIWNFFLFSASHPSSNVRLAAYQATGSFLLKLSPYLGRQIQATFSEVSTMTTIDLKSSAIIASAFAYMSKTVALPRLVHFINSTPVFHHFTVADSLFSEHLASIISNLGLLGIEWFSTCCTPSWGR
jgi:hypothetical protein